MRFVSRWPSCNHFLLYSRVSTELPVGPFYPFAQYASALPFNPDNDIIMWATVVAQLADVKTEV